MLSIANFLALICALILSTNRFHDALSSFASLLRTAGNAVALGLLGWFALPALDVPWRDLTTNRKPRALLPLARGLAITVPLLLVFALLLSSADAAFGRLLGNLFTVRLDEHLPRQAAITAFWYAVAAAALRPLLEPASPASPGTLVPSRFKLGLLEIGMALGGLNLLFAAFIAVQFGYFFGGSANVTALTGLTYAEYARRGSTELIQVVALTLPVLILALRWRDDTPRAALIVRGLSSLTLVMLGVMLLSAWQRLELYREAYGLTEIRFYTAAFIVWLAGILVLFVVTVLREQYALFPRGVIIAAFTALAMLNLLNPSAVIVNANLTRAANGREFDAPHAMRLSADGVIALLQGVDRLNGASLETAQRLLQAAKTTMFRNGDWRSFNIAKARASVLLEGVQTP
jgi:Domain of unknown function (DUF4173)